MILYYSTVYVLHDKYTKLYNKKIEREKLPSSSGLVWKLASADRSVLRADTGEARRVTRKSFICMSKSRPQSRK